MRTHEELETLLKQEQAAVANPASHHASFLSKQLNYHRNTMFQKFCRDIYPDFKQEESRGYLSGKFGQFQYRFIAFLAELDQSRLEKLENAISQNTETTQHGH